MSDLNNSIQHILSIRLSADGFSFSVFNPSDDSSFDYVTCRIDPGISLTANLKQTLAEHELLRKPFKRTNILVAASGYTLIPFELFEDEQVEEIYYCNHARRHNEVVLYNILDRSNLVVAFAMDKSTCNLIDEQYPEADIFATVSPVIEHCLMKSRMGANRKMYLNLQRRTVDVLAYEHGHLLFANTFPEKGYADTLYYALGVWKELGLSQETDELYLIGDCDGKEQLVTELRRFVKNVAMVNPAAEFNRAPLARVENMPYDMQALLLGKL